MKRRGRPPTTEERALWRKVTETVAPRAEMPPSDMPAPDLPAPDLLAQPPRAPQPLQQERPLRSLRPIGSGNGPSLSLPETGDEPPSGLDRRTQERLRKGRRAPDSRLDLHGMSAARAHRVLVTFLTDARARGDRCVLVITGKGGPGEREPFGPERPGVLRREAPIWLASPPLSRMIVNVSQAHPRHGGSGALYVYLKRIR